MPTSTANSASSRLFAELKPGDRVEVVHDVKIGSSADWTTTTVGTVVRTERRRHGLHFRRNPDDKVYSDVLILARDDGELTTVTMDEYTQLRKL
jgi:(p)ppGpp synthase/HD superfamily hydrolase